MEISIRRYTELPYLIDYLRSKELVLLSPKLWDDRNDSYYIEQFALSIEHRSTYALCLTESSETFHHWKVFSHGGAGVCVEFDKSELIRAVKLCGGMRAEMVKYMAIESLNVCHPSPQDLPFLKRYAFRDEKEFRIFYSLSADGPPVFRFPVPLKAIKRIVLSPWLPSTVAENVKGALRSIEGCERLRIYKSKLLENDDWKIFATHNKS